MKKIFYLVPVLLFSVLMVSCTDDDDESLTAVQEDNTESVMANYYLNATGQTKLYDKDGNEISSLSAGESCYGQDGNYQKGVVMSYSDNGDETITDNNTGLMWEQIPSSDAMTWDEAKEYCENLTLGGYDDWRMPSPKELYSISDFEEGWPYINTDFFKLVQDELTKDEQYWSNVLYVGQATEQQAGVMPNVGTDISSDSMGMPQGLPPMAQDASSSSEYQQKAFGVNYATGHIKAYNANAGGIIGGKYIRAVRGDIYGDNNYTDNNDETITDSSTGLMWSKNDSGESMDWEAALSYAENSTLAGYDDWRLPNVKELQNIVDYSYSPSAEDASDQGAAINKIFNCTEITNEAGDSDYPYYWSSTSARFQAGGKMYYAWYVAFGRAVDGDGQDVHGAGAVRYDVKYNSGVEGEGGERYYNYVRLVRDAE